MIGIYKITETETGKCYIGQSRRMESRLKDHNKRFHPDTHTYEVLMTCTAEALDRMEIFFIQVWNTLAPSGLNKTIGGGGLLNVSRKGQHLSEEHRAKLSVAMAGRKHNKTEIEAKQRSWTPERRSALSERNRIRWAQQKELMS